MKPTLVIMAAGLGARYGGLKQMEAMDEEGQLLIDYSMYDAMEAGFGRVVCIIKEEMGADFEERVARRVRPHIPIECVYQRMEDLPAGFAVPEGRVRPWGTCQALLALRGTVKGPFAAINADDYYGPSALRSIHDWLREPHGTNEYAMVGYPVALTLTDHGTVTRGICRVENGMLSAIRDCKNVRRGEGGITGEVDGITYPIPEDAIASMNLWGFPAAVLNTLEERFPAFLAGPCKADPLNAEYLIPVTVGELLAEGRITVRVLPGGERWFGVTYRKDKPAVEAALRALQEAGFYPRRLWD